MGRRPKRWFGFASAGDHDSAHGGLDGVHTEDDGPYRTRRGAGRGDDENAGEALRGGELSDALPAGSVRRSSATSVGAAHLVKKLTGMMTAAFSVAGPSTKCRSSASFCTNSSGARTGKGSASQVNAGCVKANTSAADMRGFVEKADAGTLSGLCVGVVDPVEEIRRIRGIVCRTSEHQQRREDQEAEHGEAHAPTMPRVDGARSCAAQAGRGLVVSAGVFVPRFAHGLGTGAAALGSWRVTFMV